MAKDDIIAMTNQVFADAFEVDPADLQPGKHIFNDLGLDSLDTVDLIVALQKKFGVQIRDDERVRQIRTLGDVYEFIWTIKQEGSAGSSAPSP